MQTRKYGLRGVFYRMKRKISIWTALILTGSLLLGTGYPSIGIGSQTAYAANEFNVGISPAQGEVNVNVSSSIKLSFDRLVSPQSGNITVTAQGTSEPYVTIPVGSAGLISSSMEYQVKLGKDLEFNKTYTVNVPKGMFKDSLGLESQAAMSTFTTAPSINTSITATDYAPANYSRVDSSLSQLSIKLNKKLQKGGGSIRLMASADNSVVQEFKLRDGEPYAYLLNDASTSTTTVTLTLSNRLTAGSSYYVLIDPYALKDDDNKSFAGISTGNVWSFSVKGAAVPGITVSPANGAGAVSVTAGIQLTFDQPMMPATGVITVSPGNTADARYFNVNSGAVTGGGTRFITVAAASAASPLLNNTQYTVTIPKGAFYDQDGNVFPASGPYSWTFTTTTLTGYDVASLSPPDRSEVVGITQPFKIIFTQPTTLESASGVALYKSNGTKLAVTVTGSTDFKEFTIVPSAALDNDTTYYIDIAKGAFADFNNNPFEGINGRNAWSFKTVALDKTAPLLSSAVLENNRTIRLKYDEALNSGVALMLSSFSVTVNDEKRNIDSAYIQGDSVYVTLSTGVAVGQIIKISYSSGLRNIQDLSGNIASTFSSRQVTNTVQSVLPVPKDGMLSGKTVILNFNDSLRAAVAAGYSQFYVYADGVSLGVNSISSSGASVTLGLNNVASSGQSVRVTYIAGSYPLQDSYGQNIANFSDFYIRNTSDTTAPVYQSASGSGKQIILNYNEGLSSGNLPMVSQYSVLVGSTPNYVTNVSVSGTQVTLTVENALSANSYTTVSYVPGTAGITDLNGNRAAHINLQPVSVSGSSTSTTVPNISSAIVTGDELTVTFSKSMQASSTLYTGQFAVRVDGSNVGVQTFNISGSTLRLVLSTVVKSGQTVDLSYMTGAGSILDLSGNALASFTALAVQNLTGTTAVSTASRPSYLGILAAGEFGKEYPLLKTDSATASDDRSIYNQPAKRYMLTADRLTASYEYLQKLGTPSLVFEVPATEQAAYVSVPLKPLLDAVNRNSKSAFGIRYGDNLYSLALDDVNMNSLAASLIADSSTISLVIRLEKVPSGTYTPFEQKLKTQGLQTVTSLMDIRMSAVVSGNYSSGTVISAPGEYSVRTTATLNSDQASAARLDLVYYDAAYLPTKISSAGSYTIIRASTKGNHVVGTFLSTRSFTDMSRHWANTTVALLTAKNIIDSSYGTAFKPEQKITRAEFAVMLSRGLGLLGDRETAQRFRDVQASTQTGDYIGAAAKAGIITGNTDGTFRPNDNITREQLAIMIIRAMEYTKNPITLRGTAANALSTFKDRNKIQNAAAEFVAKAVQEGIILGMTTTEFQPQGNATRAQAAVMLQRMLNMAGYL